jgi:mannose-6-phosphate isomerase-like protein (cupin superfamily)
MSHLFRMTKALDLGNDAFSISEDEGEATKGNIHPYHIKLSSKQTDGRFMLMEGIILSDEGMATKFMHTFLLFFKEPFVHVHRYQDEVFHVLEGELQFYINNQTVTVPQGTCVYAPRGVAHSFRSNADRPNPRPARLQFRFSPGDSIESYLQQAGRALNQDPPNIALLKLLANEWGVDIIGSAN